MILIQLDNDRGRTITVQHIANTVFAMKQYLSDGQLTSFKKTLEAFAALIELSEITKKYDSL